MNLWTHSTGTSLARPFWAVLIVIVAVALVAPTTGSGQEIADPAVDDTPEHTEGHSADAAEPTEAAGADQDDGADQVAGTDDEPTVLPTKTPIPPLKDDSTRRAFSQMLAALLVVLVLVVVAAVVGKKFLPRLASRGDRQLRLLETQHLAPKSAVHLMRVGNRVFLLGTAKEGVTSLGDVTDAMTESPQPDKGAGDE